MNPLKSNLLAWSVAIASLALWATSAQVSFGQVASGTARLFDQSTTSTDDTSIVIDSDPSTNDISTQNAVCPTPFPAPVVPPAIAQLLPTLVPLTPPAPSGQDGTYHICGADSGAERAIEQLVAGRGFSATLTARGDGCADLTVHPSGQVSNGSSSSNLSVSLGSGRTLSIQIVSEQGATRASITSR